MVAGERPFFLSFEKTSIRYSVWMKVQKSELNNLRWNAKKRKYNRANYKNKKIRVDIKKGDFKSPFFI